MAEMLLLLLLHILAYIQPGARDVRTAKLHQNSYIKQFDYTAQLDSSEQQTNTIKTTKYAKIKRIYIQSHYSV